MGVGDLTEGHWNDYCADNVVGFELKDGKCKLAGPFEYFYLSDGASEQDYFSKEQSREHTKELLADFENARVEGIKLEDALVYDYEPGEYDGPNLVAVVNGYKFGLPCWIKMYFDPDTNITQMEYFYD